MGLFRKEPKFGSGEIPSWQRNVVELSGWEKSRINRQESWRGNQDPENEPKRGFGKILGAAVLSFSLATVAFGLNKMDEEMNFNPDNIVAKTTVGPNNDSPIDEIKALKRDVTKKGEQFDPSLKVLKEGYERESVVGGTVIYKVDGNGDLLAIYQGPDGETIVIRTYP